MELKRKKIDKLENRVSKLESWAHPPINWDRKIKSLEDAFKRLYNFVKKNIVKK